MIVPEETELTAVYWEGARQGRLLVQCCRDCGSIWHPPSYTCRACMSFENDWIDASGRGTVHSYTVVRHSVHPVTDDRVPYAVGLVELEEGPIMVTSLRCAIPDIEVGMEVSVTFAEVAPDLVLPMFEPTE